MRASRVTPRGTSQDGVPWGGCSSLGVQRAMVSAAGASRALIAQWARSGRAAGEGGGKGGGESRTGRSGTGMSGRAEGRSSRCAAEERTSARETGGGTGGERAGACSGRQVLHAQRQGELRDCELRDGGAGFPCALTCRREAAQRRRRYSGDISRHYYVCEGREASRRQPWKRRILIIDIQCIERRRGAVTAEGVRRVGRGSVCDYTAIAGWRRARASRNGGGRPKCIRGVHSAGSRSWYGNSGRDRR
ncbi:hypothetical protein C8R47DRAFT_1163904 [Mycena vitilis]|nr:hypothetical protein C8R47DRAFT_1163904 [Mycena vitilis]